jgi:hypothetical protein
MAQVGLLDQVSIDAEPVERRRHVDRIPRDHAVGRQVQAHGRPRLLSHSRPALSPLPLFFAGNVGLSGPFGIALLESDQS